MRVRVHRPEYWLPVGIHDAAPEDVGNGLPALRGEGKREIAEEEHIEPGGLELALLLDRRPPVLALEGQVIREVPAGRLVGDPDTSSNRAEVRALLTEVEDLDTALRNRRRVCPLLGVYPHDVTGPLLSHSDIRRGLMHRNGLIIAALAPPGKARGFGRPG